MIPRVRPLRWKTLVLKLKQPQHSTLQVLSDRTADAWYLTKLKVTEKKGCHQVALPKQSGAWEAKGWGGRGRAECCHEVMLAKPQTLICSCVYCRRATWMKRALSPKTSSWWCLRWIAPVPKRSKRCATRLQKSWGETKRQSMLEEVLLKSGANKNDIVEAGVPQKWFVRTFDHIWPEPANRCVRGHHATLLQLRRHGKQRTGKTKKMQQQMHWTWLADSIDFHDLQFLRCRNWHTIRALKNQRGGPKDPRQATSGWLEPLLARIREDPRPREIHPLIQGENQRHIYLENGHACCILSHFDMFLLFLNMFFCFFCANRSAGW